jgi:hypothetical protein
MLAKGQSIQHATPYEHHQNSIAEKMIRDLQDLARTALLHSQRAWPDAIHQSLWPYALRKAAYDLNNIARVDQDLTAYQQFTNASVHSKITSHRTFGCPVYVLQSPKYLGKWQSKSRLAIYIGLSVQYASTV